MDHTPMPCGCIALLSLCAALLLMITLGAANVIALPFEGWLDNFMNHAHRSTACRSVSETLYDFRRCIKWARIPP